MLQGSIPDSASLHNGHQAALPNGQVQLHAFPEQRPDGPQVCGKGDRAQHCSIGETQRIQQVGELRILRHTSTSFCELFMGSAG